MKDNTKEDEFVSWRSLIVATGILVMFAAWVFLPYLLETPGKPDGELWITVNGSRVNTTYYGHYEVQCLCKYLMELNYSCGDRYMGCGAVNCECFNWTARLQNDIGDWKSYHSGGFVQGEGLVCK